MSASLQLSCVPLYNDNSRKPHLAAFEILERKNHCSSKLIPLFLPEKFPVPLGREFSCKRLNLLADWAPKSQMQAAIGEIPCKIPC
jgi:hypothetical protein